jgi:hypothetical protein
LAGRALVAVGGVVGPEGRGEPACVDVEDCESVDEEGEVLASVVIACRIR